MATFVFDVFLNDELLSYKAIEAEDEKAAEKIIGEKLERDFPRYVRETYGFEICFDRNKEGLNAYEVILDDNAEPIYVFGKNISAAIIDLFDDPSCHYADLEEGFYIEKMK